jgi:hypothetical protein
MIERQAPFNVVVAYIAVSDPNLYSIDTYAPRFRDTYLKFSAGYPHRLIVVCNGGNLTPFRQKHFSGLDCEFYPRPNDGGKDISGYQAIAHTVPCDFLVCLGDSVYFHREGWLKRLVEARLENGPGMYGVFASHYPIAHLCTSFFGVDPCFLRRYPPVTNHTERYVFEHGGNALWRRIVASKAQARLVTFDGDWEPGKWRKPQNCYWKGDQSNCLARVNHLDRWESQREDVRRAWTDAANSPFA